MLILYAVLAGIVAGYLVGGRLERLGSMGFRWAPLAIAGFVVQLLIFGPLDRVVGPAGLPLYIGSTLAVLAAVVRNIAIPGLALVSVGTISNLAAILANGGVMPADPGAVTLAGIEHGPGFSNSAIVGSPALAPLTDVYALPAGVPLANVFSIGDVVIGAGVVVAIVVAMRSSRPGASRNMPLQPARR
jgi:uncharacterized protein DUF5317